MVTIGSVIANKYKVMAQLASSDVSQVFVVIDEAIDRLRVMKVINTTGEQADVATKLALNEINVLKQLETGIGPELIDVIDHGVMVYIVETYLQGQTLADILHQPSVDAEQLYPIVLQWLRVLDRLHTAKQRVIHGDLKPEHVVIAAASVYLVDFGVSTLADDTTVAAMGTPPYAMREQMTGYRGVQNDLYAFGKILSELFPKLNRRTVIFEDIVAQCLQLTPDSALSAKDLIAQLERKQTAQSLPMPVKRIIWGLHGVLILIGMFGSVWSYQYMMHQKARYEQLLVPGAAVSDVTDKENIYHAIQYAPNRLQGYHALLDSIEKTGLFATTDYHFLMMQLQIQQGHFEDTTQNIGDLYRRFAFIMTIVDTVIDPDKWVSKSIQDILPYYALANRYAQERVPVPFAVMSRWVSLLQHIAEKHYSPDQLATQVKQHVLDVTTQVLDDPQFPFAPYAAVVYAAHLEQVMTHLPLFKQAGLTEQEVITFVNRLRDGLQRVPLKQEIWQHKQQHLLNKRQQDVELIKQFYQKEKS